MSDTVRIYARYTAQQNASAPVLQPKSVLSPAAALPNPIHDFVMNLVYTGSNVRVRRLTLSDSAQSATLTLGPVGGVLVIADDPYFASYAGQIAICDSTGVTAYGSILGGATAFGGASANIFACQFTATCLVTLVHPTGDYVVPAQPIGVTAISW